jgi:NhaP-type Na+/H+ or K+/H+ antiporter
MPAFSPELFLSTLALTGAVILVSSLFSGAIEKSGVPQVAVFLAIGAVLGPFGFALIEAPVNSPILRVVATLSLGLVLFTDAVGLNLKELREQKLLAALVLGPGTLLSAAIVAVLGWLMLGLQPAMAAILGAALSSTDPVLLRSFLVRPGLPRAVRQGLRLESGMNDAVLLPVVLVAIAMSMSGGLDAGGWADLALKMLVLSPGVGVLVAVIAIETLQFVRRRTGVRRDYESIYSLGIAFVAFAAAEAVHGSGFLAAFAAGLAVSALDVELCDCFLEYGETTAEMALLFAFVLFGASVVWTGLDVLSPITIFFSLLVFVARPAAFLPALLPAQIPWRQRLLIAFFGPRGLSSLLLVLLPVFAAVPGSGKLVPLCALVVLCSIVVHGFSPLLLGRSRQPGVEDASIRADGIITLDGYRELVANGETVTLLDVRTERTLDLSPNTAAGAIRIDPARAVVDAEAKRIPHGNQLVAFCH